MLRGARCGGKGTNDGIRSGGDQSKGGVRYAKRKRLREAGEGNGCEHNEVAGSHVGSWEGGIEVRTHPNGCARGSLWLGGHGSG